MLTRPTDDLEDITSVVHLYRLLLQRVPDRSGLLHHADRLASGESLPRLAGALLDSDESRALWDGLSDREIAWRLWSEAERDDGRRARRTRAGRFEAAWAHAPDLAGFIAILVSGEAVRAVSILPCLFPDGIDPSHDDVYRAWAYRLWSREAERILSDRARQLLPSLRLLAPMIGLTIELDGSERALELEVTIASLCEQIYGRWRLLLRGPLPSGFVLPDDPRMSLTRDESCVVAGRWAGWLRPGDTLSPSALALFGFAILRRPRAIAFYCDEDQREPNGLCASPVLKTAWDPDAAEQIDLAGGLALFEARHLARRVGTGTRSTAHARLLRATDRVSTGRIGHLPSILYHRLRPAQPEVPDAVVRLSATPMFEHRPPVSVVIATRDRAHLLERCVRSLRDCTDYPAVEIVIVDNGSTEPDALRLLDRLGRDGCRVLRRPGPFNWSGLNNEGVRAASGEVVVLMNNDVTCVEPGWLGEMVTACLRPGVGVVGALLLFEHGAVQHAGVLVGPGPHAAHAEVADTVRTAPLQNFAAVTGACMAFRRTVFDQLRGLDAVALPVTWNDIDFCLRARKAGLRVLLARRAVLMHAQCGTRTPDDAAENQPQLLRTRAHVMRRHRRDLRADPFLSPFLMAASGGSLLDPLAPQAAWRILRRGGR